MSIGLRVGIIDVPSLQVLQAFERSPCVAALEHIAMSIHVLSVSWLAYGDDSNDLGLIWNTCPAVERR